MKAIRRQLQQALRALEFANAGSLAQLEAMLESRDAAMAAQQAKAACVEAARRTSARPPPFSGYRFPQAAGQR